MRNRLGGLAGLAVVVFCLDLFFFRFLIWRLPNESAWNTNQFFNALYSIHKVGVKKKKRILLVGSSIAYYSFNTEKLSSFLKDKTGQDYEVVVLAYAGMTPFDANMLSNTILDMKPDLVVYPINFIDFRMHRPYVMNKGYNNETVPNDTMLLDDSLNLEEAPQSKYLYPEEVLIKYGFKITPDRTAVYLSSVLFGFYRYREIVLDHWREVINHHFSRNTSYHAYMGVQIPERVTSRGWTGKVFSFKPTSKMTKEGIWLEVVPELLQESPLEILFTTKEKQEKYIFRNPGWHQIKSPMFADPTVKITVELSATWEPYHASGLRFDYLHDRLGVRLQQTFGLEYLEGDNYFHREERLEDLRFQEMSHSDYKKYFYEHLLKDPHKRPGIAYLHALQVAKRSVSAEKFHPTFQFQQLEMLTQKLILKNVKLLLVNHPENPISLEWYVNSAWYGGYLGFMKSLAIVNTVEFIDLKNSLDMRDFNDFHHVTYDAATRLNKILGNRIIKSL